MIATLIEMQQLAAKLRELNLQTAVLGRSYLTTIGHIEHALAKRLQALGHEPANASAEEVAQ